MSDHSPGSSPVQGSDDDAPIPVLAAVIRRGDRYLLAKRPAHKRHGGLWEFPGGKLEPGEGWLEAARRELREELRVQVVRAGDPVFRRHDAASGFEIVFVPVEIEGEPEALEHEELRWVGREELARPHLDRFQSLAEPGNRPDMVCGRGRQQNCGLSTSSQT